MNTYLPEGRLLNTQENRAALASLAGIKDAMFHGTVLEGRALLCDKEHNLHVELGTMRGIIPRNECAMGIEDGSVRDIAIISRVNKPVMFKVLELETDLSGTSYAVLSRRAVQEEYLREYIGKLSHGDVIDVTVTHLENFGAFCDVGAGISALLPIDGISVSRIPHPNVRFAVNQQIRAVVKDIDESLRLTLSHKELLGTWEENAALFSIGETVPGIVRSVEKYGIFIELTANLAGLAEYADGIYVGQHTSVYIKNIIPEKMKIKLIIVDSFSAEYPLPPVRYFMDINHIDSFLYSPEHCDKRIESVFE
ncbi:MAG: S1 RNA-binding domain-containing protein [Oscillospiraceae bacterium]|jgi:small subunit ribosomal protein S1|nr:S1 RNA-binding domain-containing protein [Oscillospiraceae bacterium]